MVYDSLASGIHWCADLKAFEQRLIECVGYTKARTKKWKGELIHPQVPIHLPPIYVPPPPPSVDMSLQLTWLVTLLPQERVSLTSPVKGTGLYNPPPSFHPALLIIIGLWMSVSVFIWWLDDTEYV